jgi:hypothetical protein
MRVLKLDKPAKGVPPAPLPAKSGADTPERSEYVTVVAE